MPFHLSNRARRDVAYWFRYPYRVNVLSPSDHPQKTLYGIIYGCCVVLSLLYTVYQMFGTPNMYRLHNPESLVLPYAYNSSNEFDAKLVNIPTPAYCSKGAPKGFDKDLYPEAPEVNGFAGDTTASSCEPCARVSCIAERTPSGFFIRTLRVVEDLSTGAKNYYYTKHPEYLTFGIKLTEIEQVRTFTDGIKVFRSDNRAMSGQGKIEWGTIGDLIATSIVSLDKVNKDGFYTQKKISVPESTYRQTGVVLGVTVEYYNFPRTPMDIGAFSYVPTAEIRVAQVPGMRGKLDGKKILDPTTGLVSKVIYDYGVYINIIQNGQIGVLEFSMWMLCAAGSFMALYIVSSFMDWISSSHDEKMVDSAANAVAKDKSQILKEKQMVELAEGMKGGNKNRKKTGGLEDYDETIYQIPFVRGLYDDSAHDIERAMRARTRSAFGPKQDFMLAGHSLAKAAIPLTVRSLGSLNSIASSSGSPEKFRQSTPAKTMSMSDMSGNLAGGGFDEDEIAEMREHIKHLEDEVIMIKNMQHDLSKKLATKMESRSRPSFSVQSPTSSLTAAARKLKSSSTIGTPAELERKDD